MQYDDERYDMYAPEQKHSGLGIAAFIIGIVVGLLEFGLVLIAGIMESQQPGGINEESPEAMAVGFGLFLLVGLNFLGGILGVAGLFSQNRLKVFAILGLLVNGLLVLGLVALMLVGIAMG